MAIATKIMVAAINEFNSTVEDTALVEAEDTFVLMGTNSLLDSLSLVRLFVTIERIIEEFTNKEITLIDESSFDTEEGPFGTVGSLTVHIDKLISYAGD